MQTNAVPHYDDSVNTTGCCPKFNPAGWDDQELHFNKKTFIRATTKSLFHIPINMGRVFSRVQAHMVDAEAFDADNCIVLSRDLTTTRAEHLFSVSAPVAEEQQVTLSGNFVTRVFEGPYRKVKTWQEDMEALVRERGSVPDEVFFFYTTCPKCARAYGQNYVVGVARI